MELILMQMKESKIYLSFSVDTFKDIDDIMDAIEYSYNQKIYNISFVEGVFDIEFSTDNLVDNMKTIISGLQSKGCKLGDEEYEHYQIKDGKKVQYTTVHKVKERNIGNL